jgi:hypothetical protein
MDWVIVMVFNVTFNNISVISWLSVSLVELRNIGILSKVFIDKNNFLFNRSWTGDNNASLHLANIVGEYHMLDCDSINNLSNYIELSPLS